MDYQQIALLILLFIALILFASGWIRYDLVSALTLTLAVFLGLVPFNKAFSGFSHAAVITVAAVFVISRAVENTGILEELASHLKLRKKIIWKQIAIIGATVIVLSAFINNVGAVALMIPVTLKIARIKNIPRGLMLMPLAFSSLLGGLLTLIGTPPNIIISDYRSNFANAPFSFFDFTPVGLGVAFVGVLFISFLGWRLIPLIKRKKEEAPHEEFTVELRMMTASSLINKRLSKMMREYKEKFQFLALVRDGEVIHENLERYKIEKKDSFILETDKWTLRELMDQYKLYIEPKQEKTYLSDYYLTEIALLPQSDLCRHTIAELKLQEKYGFEIIAVSRRGTSITERLGDITLEAGDSLLIKSKRKITPDQVIEIDCVLIEETRIRPFSLKKTIKVISIFVGALICVVTGLLKVDVAFFAAAVIMLLTKCLSLDNAYKSINMPIIILIGTLIPVGEAIDNTGTAKMIAEAIYTYGQTLPTWANIFILMMVCMLLSNLINNAAVALLFAPIALQMSVDWGASVDPFLMAVAVGSSCTFLTPIGHQSNALVLGPGNYRFSDYWLMGLPLTLLIGVIGTILIMYVWPLNPN